MYIDEKNIHSLAHIDNIHIVMRLSLEYNFAYFCGSLGAEFFHIFFSVYF